MGRDLIIYLVTKLCK